MKPDASGASASRPGSTATTGAARPFSPRDPGATGQARCRLGANVSVGMSAYGNDETTRAALRCLLAAAEGDFELLLVDDCSPDGGRVREVFCALQRERPNTRVFVFDRNQEYSGSLNCILSHARGEQVLFLSNDIFVTPAYLRTLLEVAAKDARLGIVRGCSNFVDNRLASHNVALRRWPASGGELFALGEQIRLAWGQAHLPDRFLTGDAFLVTRAVIERIGTFDPLFFGYFADHDYGLRAQIAGFEPSLARGAFALHEQDANLHYLSEDDRETKLHRRWARVYENWARFKVKYGLPVDMPYSSVNHLPWESLRAEAFARERHFVKAGDYGAWERVAAGTPG